MLAREHMFLICDEACVTRVEKKQCLTRKEPHMIRLLGNALAYAARGWYVLPVHTPGAQGCSCGQDCGGSAGKHPRTLHGHKDASRQPDQIWQWWHRWPDANIGIRTG